MARDADTDYTMSAGFRGGEKYGPAFTGSDVGTEWLLSCPSRWLDTAERSAYRNLVYGMAPPRPPLSEPLPGMDSGR